MSGDALGHGWCRREKLGQCCRSGDDGRSRRWSRGYRWIKCRCGGRRGSAVTRGNRQRQASGEQRREGKSGECHAVSLCC